MPIKYNGTKIWNNYWRKINILIINGKNFDEKVKIWNIYRKMQSNCIGWKKDIVYAD